MKDRKTPLYITLYEDIKSQIESGILKDGQKLMSIRSMISERGLSRTTIESAYEMLCAKGFATCKSQSGYFVTSWANTSKQKKTKSSIIPQNHEIIYDFTGKKIEVNVFNFTEWRAIVRAVMQEFEEFSGYGNPLGERKLRSAICHYLFAGRGAYYDYHNIVIGAGVQSLLHIISEMFDKERYMIAFENPGFKKGYRIFKDHGFRVAFVNGDTQGISIDELYKSGANMLYISPAHSFPTGASLGHEKRKQLLRWASDVDGFIIEDDYDGEFRYSGKPLSSLMRMDTEERVIYLGTFSKIMPPSIRISYAVLPDRLQKIYEDISVNYNQTSSTVEQLALARFIEDGKLERQIRRLKRNYAKKNQLIIEAFKKYFGDKTLVNPNDTGLHIMAEFTSEIDTKELSSLARERGVAVIPMSSYTLDDGESFSSGIYISCVSIEKEKISEGIKILSECADLLFAKKSEI